VLPTLPEGYEVKGLQYPGRDRNFDCNSQVPTGYHNERTVFYVFGRYPKWEDHQRRYPITDLIVCHGDFLNATRNYAHKNCSTRGFGSYGDILLRDRKMYVAPTPFALTNGTIGNRTLILPENMKVDERFKEVGRLERTESDWLLSSYTFNFDKNNLKGDFADNPTKGKVHRFVAYRCKEAAGDPVEMSTVKDFKSEEEDDCGD